MYIKYDDPCNMQQCPSRVSNELLNEVCLSSVLSVHIAIVILLV